MQVRSTWEEGDTERFVIEALDQTKFDTIVAAGGDGTVNEVAQALVSHNAPRSTRMAILPVGTANDLATGKHHSRTWSQLYIIFRRELQTT